MRLPRRTCKARALPVFHLDTFRAHAVVEAAARVRGPVGGRGQAGRRSLTRALASGLPRRYRVRTDACKSPVPDFNQAARRCTSRLSALVNKSRLPPVARDRHGLAAGRHSQPTTARGSKELRARRPVLSTCQPADTNYSCNKSQRRDAPSAQGATEAPPALHDSRRNQISARLDAATSRHRFAGSNDTQPDLPHSMLFVPKFTQAREPRPLNRDGTPVNPELNREPSPADAAAAAASVEGARGAAVPIRRGHAHPGPHRGSGRRRARHRHDLADAEPAEPGAVAGEFHADARNLEQPDAVERTAAARPRRGRACENAPNARRRR